MAWSPDLDSPGKPPDLDSPGKSYQILEAKQGQLWQVFGRENSQEIPGLWCRARQWQATSDEHPLPLSPTGVTGSRP